LRQFGETHAEQNARGGEAQQDGGMDGVARLRVRYRCSSMMTRGLRLRSLSIARI
jgi:hypothetical protein